MDCEKEQEYKDEYLPMDALSIYRRQMPRVILNFDEEKYYFEMLREGRKEYREIIIKANLLLARSIAERFFYQGLSAGLEKADLIQEANLALTRAVDKFDYRLNRKFSTYAYKAITRRLRRAIDKYKNTKYGFVYLDETLEDNDIDNYNFVILEENPVEEEVFKNNLETIVLHLYNSGILTYKEFTIIKLRHGLFGLEEHVLRECGKNFNINSREGVRLILKDAYEKIREYLKEEKIEKVEPKIKVNNPQYISISIRRDVSEIDIKEEAIISSCKALITNDFEYTQFLKIFDFPIINKIIEHLDLKEQKIILYKLGFINRYYYKNSQLSTMLNLEQIEIGQVFERILQEFKKLIFDMINNHSENQNLKKKYYVPNYTDFIFGYLNIHKYFNINGMFEQFIKLRYGFIDGICLSNKQVGNIISLSSQTIEKYFKCSIDMLLSALEKLFVSAIDYDKKRDFVEQEKEKTFSF